MCIFIILNKYFMFLMIMNKVTQFNSSKMYFIMKQVNANFAAF